MRIRTFLVFATAAILALVFTPPCAGSPYAQTESRATRSPQDVSPPAGPDATKALSTAQKDGVALTTISDLSASVSVEAVLLPYDVAKRTFGKEVAERYAVVSLIVSNRDQKQGMILHSVFLDYSQWLFSGIFAGMSQSAKVPTELWQQQNNPSQVSSAEVRTVRTDFQDAQVWSARNWVIHIATGVGATAAGLSFATASDLFLPSVAAFTGDLVPALSNIWPDNSQNQLNLLNDIGFRTNRVISAKSSDVVVAFFPLSRFLTPQFQKIYKKAPAAFFNPSELLFEKSSRSGTGNLLRELERTGLVTPAPCTPPAAKSDAKADTHKADKSAACALAASVKVYEVAYGKARLSTAQGSKAKDPCINPEQSSLTPTDCFNVGLLNRFSLNNIRVIVGGIMTVDAASVHARISDVYFADEEKAATWSMNRKLTGTLTGSFLSGGTISIAATDPDGTALTPFVPDSLVVDTTTGNASDSSLPFSATVGSADIAPESKLVFTVTKVAEDKSTTTSAPRLYIVNPDPTLQMASGTTWTPATRTFSGTFAGKHLASVTLLSVSGIDPTGQPLLATNFDPKTISASDTSLTFSVDIVGKAVPTGSTLSFLLSSRHPDGSPVSVSCIVPSCTATQ